jgi:hypothetical protein
MIRKLNRKLLFGVALVAVLAGVTAAIVMAAEPGSHKHTHHHRQLEHHRKASLLAAAASYLGSSPGQLRSELRSGKSLAAIANATGGRSSQGLIKALESADEQRLAKVAGSLQARITATVERPGGGLDDARGSSTIQTASGYLGLSTRRLRGELRSGKTLAQIAAASGGKSEAGLIEALLAVRKARLEREVQAGAITQAQANARLPELEGRVASRVNRARHPHPVPRG